MRILILFLLCIISIFCFSCASKSTENDFYRFQGQDGRNVYVDFININGKEYVDVRLGDGMKLKLKGVISGSGARYSNGNYVLWNKGDKIMIMLNDKITFEGKEVCQAESR